MQEKLRKIEEVTKVSKVSCFNCPLVRQLRVEKSRDCMVQDFFRPSNRFAYSCSGTASFVRHGGRPRTTMTSQPGTLRTQMTTMEPQDTQSDEQSDAVLLENDPSSAFAASNGYIFRSTGKVSNSPPWNNGEKNGILADLTEAYFLIKTSITLHLREDSLGKPKKSSKMSHA